MDDPDFVDKRIWTLCQYGATSALSALAKTESANMKELIARVLNAFCQHQELRGLVIQQGGSKALVPIALSSTEKGERHAAQALSRIGITQDPSIAFPGQRSCDVVRPIAKLLKDDCKSIENFEALLALGNLANVSEAVRGRMLKESDCIMSIETYMYEDHKMLRRAAVQCVLNLCQSEVQVRRFEGNNDRMKYMVLLMGDGEDEEVAKAAAGAVATLTSYSSKLCKRIYESTQWEACMLNTLANKDYEVTHRGAVIVANIIAAGRETAEPLMDTKILDVCQALILRAKMDASNYQPDVTLQPRSIRRRPCGTTGDDKLPQRHTQPLFCVLHHRHRHR